MTQGNDPTSGSSDLLGKTPRRIDARQKVTGRAQYVDDLRFPRMLHAALATSPWPHGAIRAIDPSRAAAAAGVHAVYTWRDVPGENQVGVVTPDQPLLVEDRARFVGDRLAIVVADTVDQARAAARLVAVEGDPLPVVTDPVEALAPGAPPIHPGGNLVDHQKVSRGDVDRAMAAAHVVVDETFRPGYQEHAYLEPNGVVAVPEPDGSMTIYGSMQCPFYIQKAVAKILGIPLARIRVIAAETGGAFGGKEDYPSEPAGCAAVAAWLTGRPVKLVFDRTEDIVRSSKRHAMVVRHRIAADADGTLVAAHIQLWVDAGAYDGLSKVVSERANVSALGPYRCPNVQVDTYVCYTNNLFGGAFRGFGTPQTTFAAQACLDLLADKLALSPAALRRRNLLQVGDSTITSQVLTESVGAVACLDAAVQRSEYEAKRAEFAAFNAKGGPIRKGVGLADVMYGCCLAPGGQHLEGSAANVHLRMDGSLEITIGGTEIGQGAFTVVAMLAAKELGVPLERVHVFPTDTSKVADSGPTVASRTTVMSGNAVLDAARQIKARVLAVGADLLGVPAERLEIEDGEVRERDGAHRILLSDLALQAYRRKADLSAAGWYAPPPKPWDRETGQGTAYVVFCFGTQVAEVEVDLFSGLVSVKKFTAAHDVGRVLNRQMLLGQVEGGVVQGMGWALMEHLKMSGGVPLNPNFTDYLIPTALDAPPVDTIFIEDPYSAGPYGAKGIGEPSLIPAPAAIAAAVRNATGLTMRELPITPERLLLALTDGGITPC